MPEVGLKVKLEVDASNVKREIETALGKAGDVAFGGFAAAGTIGILIKGLKEIKSTLGDVLGPPMQGVFEILSKTLQIFFLPFSIFMASILMPMAIWLLKVMIWMNKNMPEVLIFLGAIAAGIAIMKGWDLAKGLVGAFAGKPLALGLDALKGIGTKLKDLILGSAIWQGLKNVGIKVAGLITGALRGLGRRIGGAGGGLGLLGALGIGAGAGVLLAEATVPAGTAGLFKSLALKAEEQFPGEEGKEQVEYLKTLANNAAEAAGQVLPFMDVYNAQLDEMEAAIIGVDAEVQIMDSDVIALAETIGTTKEEQEKFTTLWGQTWLSMKTTTMEQSTIIRDQIKTNITDPANEAKQAILNLKTQLDELGGTTGGTQRLGGIPGFVKGIVDDMFNVDVTRESRW